MGRSGGLKIAAVVCTVILGGASPSEALNCTPCTGASPRPVQSSDYQPINVIGGTKNVFNTMTELPKWDRVRRLIEADAMRGSPQMQPWVAWAEGLRGQPVSERLNAINSRVNQRIRYVIDQISDGVPDYWQTPLETVARGTGDCEDFAILK